MAARDHAIIRILRSESIRRAEVLGMVMHSLPADVIKNPLIPLVPSKGARAAGEWRIISLAPASARALAIYLGARRHHKLADSAGPSVYRRALYGTGLPAWSRAA
jgi:integrase/recombinase XerD